MSPLGYRSEFRRIELLSLAFQHHQIWNRMKEMLQDGSLCSVKEIDKKNKRGSMEEALSFVSHKGAKEKPELLQKLTEKDVIHRYSLPLPWPKIQRLGSPGPYEWG
eukprot:14086241-Ditylum_brightwellii.AAC.1